MNEYAVLRRTILVVSYIEEEEENFITLVNDVVFIHKSTCIDMRKEVRMKHGTVVHYL